MNNKQRNATKLLAVPVYHRQAQRCNLCAAARSAPGQREECGPNADWDRGRRRSNLLIDFVLVEEWSFTVLSAANTRQGVVWATWKSAFKVTSRQLSWPFKAIPDVGDSNHVLGECHCGGRGGGGGGKRGEKGGCGGCLGGFDIRNPVLFVPLHVVCGPELVPTKVRMCTAGVATIACLLWGTAPAASSVLVITRRGAVRDTCTGYYWDGTAHLPWAPWRGPPKVPIWMLSCVPPRAPRRFSSFCHPTLFGGERGRH